MVLFLLPCLSDSVDIVMVVVMGWRCINDLMVVVQVVAEVLLQQLLVPVVALSDTGLDVAVGIALWGLVCSFLNWLVVLQYLRRIVRISGGGIPWCCK